MNGPKQQRCRVERWRPGSGLRPAEPDLVAREEPLEIRLASQRYAVTMRTPGHDLELTSGLLFSEGIVRRPADITAIGHCHEVPAPERENVVEVHLRPDLPFDLEQHRRSMLVSSSCGVCGRESIAELAARCPPVESQLKISARRIHALPELLRREQIGFAETGGLHASGLFDASGRLREIREDVGRHNAVDKLIGAALRHDLLPLGHSVLVVSGRVSFEIVQKARVAGIPVIAAVSAPSSLAIELARQGNQTLIGFVRAEGFNVYCGSERVTGTDA